MKLFNFYLALMLVIGVALETSAQWDLVQLPNKTAQHRMATHGDTVFLVAGVSGGAPSNEVQVFNTQNRTWQTPLTMDHARIFPAVTATEKAMYVIGGHDDGTWNSPVTGTSEVEVFNFKNGTWSKHDLGISLFLAQVTHVKSKIYIAGGITAYTNPPKSIQVNKYVFIYDEDADTWTKDSLLEPKHAMGIAHNDSIIMFAGGEIQLDENSKIVEIYNVNSGQWSYDSLSIARKGISAAFHNGNFYFAGGSTGGTTVTNVVDIFDGMSWDSTHLSEAKAGSKASVINDKIYFVGGGGLDAKRFVYTSASSRIDIYDPVAKNWSQETMSNGLVNHAITAHDGLLYISGGTDMTAMSTIMEIYNPKASVVNVKEGLSLVLYPNPTSGFVQISGLTDLSLTGSMRVSSIDEREVLYFNRLHNNIDLGTLPAGMYLVHIETPHGRITQKVLKQ